MINNAEALADNTRGDAGLAIILNMAGMLARANLLAQNPTADDLKMIDRLAKTLMGKADELGSWARTRMMIEADHAASS